MKIFKFFFYAGLCYFATIVPLFILDSFDFSSPIEKPFLYLNETAYTITVLSPFIIALKFNERLWTKCAFFIFTACMWLSQAHHLFRFGNSGQAFLSSSNPFSNIDLLMSDIHDIGFLLVLAGCFMIRSENIKTKFRRMAGIAVAGIIVIIVRDTFQLPLIIVGIAGALCYLPLVSLLRSLWRKDLRIDRLTAEIAIIGQPE